MTEYADLSPEAAVEQFMDDNGVERPEPTEWPTWYFKASLEAMICVMSYGTGEETVKRALRWAVCAEFIVWALRGKR